ncbi:hypothetical protein Gogos_018351 [Gossypium gossypioides]|uniref:Uncharacterized protein n=1 Tax=Gossypium gossypioides TaxID=34282 RepID=A0A7J9BDV0_GOSGO|nr:hypothetical protein [Gossypium gossypioides]
MQFICTRLYPALDTNNVNVFTASLLYSLQRKRICVGTWINQQLKYCIVGSKVGIYFLHLVIGLAWRSCPPGRFTIPFAASSMIPFSTNSKSFIGSRFNQSSDSSMDNEDEEEEVEEEEVEEEGSTEGKAPNDEVIEDDDMTPYANTTETCSASHV